MKLLFACAVMLVTVEVSAQKFELGLNGGIGFNTTPSVTTDGGSFNSDAKTSAISFVGSVKALYSRNRWQYGLQVDERQLSYKIQEPYFFLNGGSFEQRSMTNIYISKAAYPFKAFVNRKLTLRKLETYAGLSAGYWLATKCEDPIALAYTYIDRSNGNGFSIGLQGGGTYWLKKRIGINAEANADLLWLTVGDASYRLFDFPVTLGVRYKI